MRQLRRWWCGFEPLDDVFEFSCSWRAHNQRAKVGVLEGSIGNFKRCIVYDQGVYGGLIRGLLGCRV